MTNKWTQGTEEGRAWKREYDRARYPEQKEVRLQRALARRRNKRAWLLVDAARRRARTTGVAFELDGRQEELQRRIDSGYCEVTGIKFDLDGGRTYDSPSLDRRDPSKGYTYENIRVVCDLANRAMSDWGEEPFAIVAAALLAKRSQAVAPQAQAFVECVLDATT